MDVKKSFALAVLCCSLTACLDSGKSSAATNKAANDASCANQAISREKIVRWKNGKISRLVLKEGPQVLDKFLEKYQDQIELMEDNFRIDRPIAMEDFQQKATRSAQINWGADAVGAPALWNKNILGDGVIVAVIDSGVEITHPQLKNQLAINAGEIANNNIDDDGNGLVDDVNGYDYIDRDGSLDDTTGHGTHVSGIILADHANGSMRGMAPHAKLLMYDFFGDNGDGSVFDSIQAIRTAARMGAKVINASWGGSTCSMSLKTVLDELAQQDILFVTASGNDHWNIDTRPSYPAAFSSASVISVGAMTSDSLTAGFSNYGKKVHIVAPGVNIVSTWPGGAYMSDDGTSMATPFVTGAVALLRSAFPSVKAAEIKAAILASAKQGPYPVSSKGSLDVSAAYDYLNNKFGSQQTLP